MNENFWVGFEKVAKLRQDVTLGEHQIRVKKKLEKTDSLLLYHGLGSGKTLSSIAATEGQNADVVVPAALRPNYRKEVKKFTNGKDGRNIMSYEKATKSGLKGGDALVLDEVQRLNNAGSARSQAIMDAAPNYKKRILLSGTPIKNHPHELAPILRILNPKDKRVPLDEKGFRERFIQEKTVFPGIISTLRGLTPGVTESPKNLHLLADVIKGRVDYHAPASEGYPSRTDSVEHVQMSPEQTGIYNYVTSSAHPLIARKVRANLPLSKQEQSSLNAFMTGARIVSNTPSPYGGKGGSPKMQMAAQHLIERSKANPRFKAMAYSNYLEGGVKEYAKHLDKANVSYRIFSGELSDAKKKQAVDDYNNDRVKALLISGAGAEGLDLKGTRLVQILEPHWNKARVEQAVGRALRFKSHEHLPEDERHVEVKHYRSIHPEKWFNKYLGVKKPTSSDQYLSALAEKKQRLNDSFLDVLKQEGSKTASERLFVYRNIAKDKTGYVYSMRSKADGKVKGHSSNLILTGAKFKVSDAGRNRVRSEGVKNVHAGVEGTLSSKEMRGPWVPITYDPKRLNGFVRRDTGDQVHDASAVKFTPEGVFMKSAAFWEGFEKRAISAALAVHATGERMARGLGPKAAKIIREHHSMGNVTSALGADATKSWRDKAVQKSIGSRKPGSAGANLNRLGTDRVNTVLNDPNHANAVNTLKQKNPMVRSMSAENDAQRAKFREGAERRRQMESKNRWKRRLDKL